MPIIEDTVIDETGQPVVVRIEVAERPLETPSHDRRVRGDAQIFQRTKDAFQESLQLIHTCATQISTTIHNISSDLKPSEYEVQFAIKIDAKVGAFIAESSAEAQLHVKLKWVNKDGTDSINRP